MLDVVSGAHPADGRRRGLVIASCLIGSLGCVREQLPDICPSVDEGELVISELRGPQDGDDSFGHWVEVYNAAGKTVDLQGMTLRLRSSGGDELEFFVRESVEVPAGGHAVIGPGSPDDHPNWMDYAIGWDISGGDPEMDEYPLDFMRFTAAFVELEACDELIDEVFFESLTPMGTLACGNADAPPTADANDETTAGCWCVDSGDAGGQPLFGVGLPGSPGGANRCL